MAKVLFKYGTQAQYDGLAEKDTNSLYFITDAGRIYKGNDEVASDDVKFVVEVPTPESAFEGILYIVYNSGNYQLCVKNGNSVETITTSGSSDPSVEDAFTDVSYDASSEGDNATWTFTRGDGTSKQIQTPKENFLQNAQINEEGKLELTMVNGDVVTVDMAEMIADTDSVKLTEDVPFIGVDPYGGIPSTGFKKNQTLTQIIKSLVQKEMDAVVTQPSLTISMSGASTSVEAGTNVTPTIRASFNKGSYSPGLPADTGVALTSYTLVRTNNSTPTNVVDGESAIREFIEESPIQVGDGATLTYRANCAHTAGDTPKTNMGNVSSQQAIQSQSARQSNTISISGYRQFFIGSSNEKPAINSAYIRALQSKGSYSTGTKSYTVPVGAQRVVIACPATKTGMTKVINTSALNADVTDTFTKQTVKVEGANGFTAVDYNVWVFEPAVAYGQQAVLNITLA